MGAGQLAHHEGPCQDRPDSVMAWRAARWLCAAFALGAARTGRGLVNAFAAVSAAKVLAPGR